MQAEGRWCDSNQLHSRSADLNLYRDDHTQDLWSHVNEDYVLTLDEHLDNLEQHIEAVRRACVKLGKKLIKRGRQEFGRMLIARGFCHDISKFGGCEFEYLHVGSDVPRDKLELAIKQHVSTNDHHPEFYDKGVSEMPEVCIAEMVCDWLARSQEFGTCLRQWIVETAVPKYKINIEGQAYKWIMGFVDDLTENHFVR